MKTLAEMILRRDELCGEFAGVIEDYVGPWDAYDDHGYPLIETAGFIDDWLTELCAMGPNWVLEWQDVYMQLTGEHVQLWRELRELIEGVARMEIEHAKHFQSDYPHGFCDGECCKAKT